LGTDSVPFTGISDIVDNAVPVRHLGSTGRLPVRFRSSDCADVEYQSAPDWVPVWQFRSISTAGVEGTGCASRCHLGSTGRPLVEDSAHYSSCPTSTPDRGSMGLDSDADPTTSSIPTGLVSDNTLPWHPSTGLDSDADPHGRFNTVVLQVGIHRDLTKHRVHLDP